ncbi:tRNA (N(6)-L-threonylcarbamoyladenosine(37)-C(2))-methylthiotransferase MtaB [Parabacteroides sp. FAFU027]|uniref:tRNA (N(6)-L-threonylcarbamoyladenosine(37)-C(2))- methylthiotransferase MtaB n=1 Tax=Parabacteroides sp. FAFU027 TaxID=2922715 RepID=UPI001FAFC99A|nr:tRNA (N(6)-L-threonylcarbamoyladenosine(37)-C(2))-methylthiotransferase MtaB [Parabacteroides sp. FAFU027]
MIDNTQFENKTAVYFTLGCKLNFAETSTIGKMLNEHGVRPVRKGEKADICVVNTCSVTELADKKCRQVIRKLIKEHPGAYVVVTGCYAQLKGQEIAEIPEVDIVLGSNQKMDILAHLGDLRKKQKGEVVSSSKNDLKKFVHSCSSDDRTRHFLKVQDGCDYYCTYCTIPNARGNSRNGTIEELVAQAKKVAAEGGKEIVLTGVNIGDFGRTTGETFFELIQALDNVEGIDRFRISSIEPNLLTDEIIRFVAGSKRFAPHFHIPLQSGSDDVLKLMRRRYDTALFAHKVQLIKEIIPDAFIGIDVIVGSRGETEEYFEDAYRFIESLDFAQLHVFTYSERANTQALKIEHVVTPQEKQQRSKRLLDLSDERQHQFYQKYQGEIRKVLFEHSSSGKMMVGFTENYIKVQVPYQEELINTTQSVSLQEFNGDKTLLNGSLQ